MRASCSSSSSACRSSPSSATPRPSLLHRPALAEAYPNDFALWVGTEVRDVRLAERLAGGRSLPRRLHGARARGAGLDHRRSPPAPRRRARRAARASPSASSRRIWCPCPPGTRPARSREFRDALAEVDASALFYHIIDARYRAGRGRGDFAEWIGGRPRPPRPGRAPRAHRPGRGQPRAHPRPPPQRADRRHRGGRRLMAQGSLAQARRLPRGRPARRGGLPLAHRRAAARPAARPRERLALRRALVETLNRLVPILNDLGVETPWEITIGGADFDQVEPRGGPGAGGHRAGHHRGHARPPARDRRRQRAAPPASTRTW